jgi:diguanylate cyclase (GGDEF)-like protein
LAETILIADDDEDILKFVEVNLRLEKFEVRKASDGEQALKVATEERPDLVLLDVMMPKLDGFEVCQRLRSDPRTSNVSIIMLTAKSLSADKVVGLTTGADDYIIKPFDPLELIARVKSTLRRARSMRDMNPLSGLPGNVAIQAELHRRISARETFALMYADLDEFKAYNDYYGFARGDMVLKLLATILQETVVSLDAECGFVGHIGGDDFAIMSQADGAEDIAKVIIAKFDDQIGAFYDQQDRKRGYITVLDRRDEAHDFPLMSISIGVVTNSVRKIESHWEASEIASEMKQFAKKRKGSSYAFDRRAERLADGS